MSRKVNATYTSDQVKNAFKIFESLNPSAPPGHIKIDTLISALTTYGTEKLNQEQAMELVSQLEPDVNGMVNFVEYVDMMMHE